MGWGVNDEQTFASNLEKLTSKKIYNMGISSYGTVREIKKLISSEIYKEVDTVLIQYHFNDLFENQYLDITKDYSLDEFERNFKSDENNLKKTVFFLKTFKTSLRLFFADIFDKINPDANYHYIDFNDHVSFLEKLIFDNLSDKRIVVFFIKEPNMKIYNFPSTGKFIEYLLIELNEDSFFIIDEHPNAKGHVEIANEIYKKILY